jgi:hypothetical protein
LTQTLVEKMLIAILFEFMQGNKVQTDSLDQVKNQIPFDFLDSFH